MTAPSALKITTPYFAAQYLLSAARASTLSESRRPFAQARALPQGARTTRESATAIAREQCWLAPLSSEERASWRASRASLSARARRAFSPPTDHGFVGAAHRPAELFVQPLERVVALCAQHARPDHPTDTRVANLRAVAPVVHSHKFSTASRPFMHRQAPPHPSSRWRASASRRAHTLRQKRRGSATRRRRIWPAASRAATLVATRTFARTPCPSFRAHTLAQSAVGAESI